MTINLQNGVVKTSAEDAYNTTINIEMDTLKMFFYDPVKSTKKIVPTNTEIKLFVLLNCEFAAIIRLQLHDLVEQFPLLYSNVFMSRWNYDPITTAVGKTKFYNDIKEVMKKTERFMHILLSYVQYSAYWSFTDLEFLKAMVQLTLRLNSIMVQLNKNKKYHGLRRDSLIIRDILEIINDIQSYVSLNCNYKLDYTVKNIYGYTTVFSNKFDLEKVMKNLEFLNLEPPQPCSVQQYLLGNILTTNEINSISREIGSVKVNLNCRQYVSFKTIIEEIQKSSELEEIFWFQKLAFDIILKFICTKTLRHFKNNNVLDSNIRDLFYKVNIHFRNSLNYVPRDVVECLMMLGSQIQIITENDILFIKTSIKTFLSLNRVKDISETESKVLDKMSLDIFMTELANKEDDYKCYFELFEFLHFQLNKYYVPYANHSYRHTIIKHNICEYIDGKTTAPSKTTKTRARTRLTEVLAYTSIEIHEVHAKDECEIVIGLYYYCFNIIVTTNIALPVLPPFTDKDQNIERSTFSDIVCKVSLFSE